MATSATQAMMPAANMLQASQVTDTQAAVVARSKPISVL
jgi:hypothetical protein